jgi:DNA-binding CsgD family transcriptional regulator
MGGKIPQPVRLEVIKKWLQGYSRDEIAKDTMIGAGTVSGIINNADRMMRILTYCGESP